MNNSKKIITLSAAIIITLLTLGGCSSSPTIQYTDPTAVDTLSTNFSSTDLQMTTSNMVNSLVTSPLISNAFQKNGGPLIIYVNNIANNTTQHIDTGMLSDAITSQILNSGYFQLVDMNAMNSAKAQINFQNNSGMIDPASAVKMGTMTGAQYMVYGSIGEMNASNGNQQSVFYQITISMMDLRSGLIVWQNTKQIRKISN